MSMKTIFVFLSIFIIHICKAQVSDFEMIDFSKAETVAKLNYGKSLNNLPLLTYNLTNGLTTDVEKFRAIYIWVCNNISGDIKQNNIVNRKRKKYKNDNTKYLKWNEEFKKKAFKTLLKNKKTMCTGYAYLIKEMCFLANIDCKIIDGYGRTTISNVDSLETINHSWNAVKLKGKWYLCDATWSSGYMLNNYLFIKDYNDGYFLTDPILFATNHYPLDKKWFLNATLEQSEFESSPLVYGELFKHQIIPISPSKMVIKTEANDEINFSFKTLKSIPSAKIQLIKFSTNKEHSLEIYDIKNENGIISFKHKFKNKGLYDIHLKIDSDIVATYTAEIDKK